MQNTYPVVTTSAYEGGSVVRVWNGCILDKEDHLNELQEREGFSSA